MSNQRKLTAAAWAEENPTLRANEIGVEKDTKKSKVGDGVTPWNALAYRFDKVFADSRYPTKADLAKTYVKFVDENGGPLTNRHVVIKVNSTTGEVLDIVAEV